MARTPPAAPHGTVTINGNSYPVTLSQAVLDYILDGVRTAETNIGSVNSGVAQARADAAAAQATADSANQQVADVAAGVAAGSITFSASISPAVASGSRFGPGVVTTNSVTVTVSGGTGPFTYAVTYVSGDTFTVNSPTSPTSSFSTSLVAGQEKSGIYRWTVTDTFDASTYSVTVGVSASELS